jgi:hypothetical protein
MARFSKRWVVVGAFAIFGASWTVARLVASLGTDSDVIGMAVLVLVGAVVGLTMVAIAPLRPWREPLVAAVVAVGLAVGLFSLLALVGEIPNASLDPWRVLRSMGILAISAVTGAMIARRWLVANASPPWLVLLSTFVMTSVLQLAIAISRMIATPMATGIATIGAVFVGGALTQCVVPVRRIW